MRFFRAFSSLILQLTNGHHFMADSTKHLSLEPNKGKILLVLGDIVTIKVTGEDTDDGYLLVQIISQPGSGPSFMHTHVPQETFYILEGTYEVYGWDENKNKYVITAEPGAVIHIPAGKPHGFKNAGNTIGKCLAMYEPAGNMLKFFIDIGIPMESVLDPMPMDQMPSQEEIEQILAENQMEILEMPDRT